jgi:4-amino-4-deoxy-L-arabinose transferase-like glycosyltransferase
MTTEARTRSQIALGPPPLRQRPGHESLRLPIRSDLRNRVLPGRARAPRRVRGRARAWVRLHGLSLGLLGGLLLLVSYVLARGATGYPGFSDDEGTYVAQAWAATTDGALSHYTYWYDHPPLGWLQLALGSWLAAPFTDASDAVAAARGVMLIPALASAVMLYVLGRRLGLRRTFAAAAVVLFTLSPLAIASLRQIYLDNFAMPWVLAAFVLAASPRRRLWAFAGSGACFAIAVLSKETMLLLLPGLALLLWQSLDRRRRAFCLSAFGSVFVMCVLAFPLYALLKGELFPGEGHVSLMEAIRFQLFDRPSTGSVLSPSSASRQLVDSWLGTDPWLLGVGTLLALPAMAIRNLRSVAVALLVLVAAVLRPGYLPQPFVIAMLPFCALVIAGVLDAALSASRNLNSELRQHVLTAGAVTVAMLVLVAAPSWYRAGAYASSQRQNDALAAAKRWISSHLDRRSRILVDDTFYVDLVRTGFRERFGIVWFYKLDFTTNLDPSVAANLPQGWRSFDYAVSTPVIRSALAQNPGGLQQVRLALRHSRTIAAFGHPDDRVEVRRIVGIGTGSGLVPRRPKRSSGAKLRRHRRARAETNKGEKRKTRARRGRR